jgi:hypothetical protein
MGCQSKIFIAGILQCLALVPAFSFQRSLHNNNQRRKEIFEFSNPAKVSRVTSSALNSEGSNDNGGAAGGLMSMGDSLKSQLASAFGALDESDQYDAVLTGLCAKILDQPSEDPDQIVVALQDPLQLLEEMNSRRIKAGSRSLMSMIDVRVANHLSS